MLRTRLARLGKAVKARGLDRCRICRYDGTPFSGTISLHFGSVADAATSERVPCPGCGHGPDFIIFGDDPDGVVTL